MRHACVRLTGNGGAPYVRDAIAINTTPQQSECQALAWMAPQDVPATGSRRGRQGFAQGHDREVTVRPDGMDTAWSSVQTCPCAEGIGIGGADDGAVSPCPQPLKNIHVNATPLSGAVHADRTQPCTGCPVVQSPTEQASMLVPERTAPVGNKARWNRHVRA
jgi:hypothetical protein